MYQNCCHAILSVSPTCIDYSYVENARRFAELELYKHCYFGKEIPAFEVSSFRRSRNLDADGLKYF